MISILFIFNSKTNRNISNNEIIKINAKYKTSSAYYQTLKCYYLSKKSCLTDKLNNSTLKRQIILRNKVCHLSLNQILCRM